MERLMQVANEVDKVLESFLAFSEACGGINYLDASPLKTKWESPARLEEPWAPKSPPAFR
jgi:hypothetical protein